MTPDRAAGENPMRYPINMIAALLVPAAFCLAALAAEPATAPADPLAALAARPSKFVVHTESTNPHSARKHKR